MCHRILLTVLALLLASGFTRSADIYVDPHTGDDAADGQSPAAQGKSGPVQTILRGVRLAGPGDTVHLAKAVYRESVDLTGKKGEPGKPLVIDGHGAVIEGSREIDPAQWQKVAPGLYRNTTLFDRPLRRLEEWGWRWFFLFDGRMNRMGRCMKGTNAPYKSPSELKPGEWTYQKDDDHAFYVRIDPSQELSECRIATPWLVNGVSVHGAVHDLVVRNLTATHVLNDGYNISPTPAGAAIGDVLFENISSIECGDDGLSAHGDSTVRVDGFFSTGNGTGLCTVGNSVNTRLFIKDNVGYEVYFYPGAGPNRHEIANSRIQCGADNGLLVQGGKSPADICVLRLDNVVVQPAPDNPPASIRLRVADRARLEGRHVTLVGLALAIGGQGALLTYSVIAGPGSSIETGPGIAWEADRNIYDLVHFRFGPTTYQGPEFQQYQQAGGQDSHSRWQAVDAAALLSGTLRLRIDGKPIGADLASFAQ
ncbi:MAG: hypothetical protein HUU20_03380 [Pirellulales bacterium]|nr:hypothetical protein [Pirellulales bacterium]